MNRRYNVKSNGGRGDTADIDVTCDKSNTLLVCAISTKLIASCDKTVRGADKVSRETVALY